MKLKLTAKIEKRALAQSNFNLQATSLNQLKKTLIDLYKSFLYKKTGLNKDDEAKKIVEETDKSIKSISFEVCGNYTTYAPFIFNLINHSFEEGGDTNIRKLEEGMLKDTGKLRNNLKKYHRLKDRKEPGLKDIGTFKTIDALITHIEGFENIEPIMTESSNELEKEVLDTFKEGKLIEGADLLFSNANCRIYRVEGTDQKNIDALIMMSGKNPKDVKKRGDKAVRVWTECQWCTAFPKNAKIYLNIGPLIMFYNGQGRPVYELNTDGEDKFSFRDALDILKPLTELTQFIRKAKVPKDNREKIWDLIYGKKSISNISIEKFRELANHIIDNPTKHSKSVQE